MEVSLDFYLFTLLSIIVFCMGAIGLAHSYQFSNYIETNCHKFGTDGQPQIEIVECERDDDRVTIRDERITSYVNFAFGAILGLMAFFSKRASRAGRSDSQN